MSYIRTPDRPDWLPKVFVGVNFEQISRVLVCLFFTRCHIRVTVFFQENMPRSENLFLNTILHTENIAMEIFDVKKYI